MVSLAERIKLAELIEEWDRKTGTQARSPFRKLGVSKHASDDEIKKAFRNKSLQYHPDRNNGDEEEAKKIAHSHDILTKEGDYQKAVREMRDKISKWDRGNGQIHHSSQNYHQGYQGGDSGFNWHWKEDPFGENWRQQQQRQRDEAQEEQRRQTEEKIREEKLFQGYLGGVLRDILKRKKDRPMEPWEVDLWNHAYESETYSEMPKDRKKRYEIYPNIEKTQEGWVMDASSTKIYDEKGPNNGVGTYFGDLIRDLHEKNEPHSLYMFGLQKGEWFVDLLRNLNIDKDAIGLCILPKGINGMDKFQGYLGGVLHDLLYGKGEHKMEPWEVELWNRGDENYCPKPQEEGKRYITVSPDIYIKDSGYVMNTEGMQVTLTEGSYGGCHPYSGDLIRDLNEKDSWRLEFSSLEFFMGKKFIQLLKSLNVDKDAVGFSVLPEWEQEKVDDKVKKKVKIREVKPFPSPHAHTPSLTKTNRRDIER